MPENPGVIASMLRALLLLCLICPIPVRADALLIGAAASLRGALDEIVEAWPGDAVVSYAGSATLARQITAGAPFDVFISANTLWMDELSDQALVDMATARVIASNRLVVVGQGTPGALPGAWPDVLTGLPEDRVIAVGLLNAVPVGIYARQALASEGALADLLPRLVQVENVRIALALAARGNAAAAIVYASDAVAEPGVSVLAEVPEAAHEPILYPAAVVTASEHSQAEAFLSFLRSDGAQAILQSHGFGPAPGD